MLLSNIYIDNNKYYYFYYKNKKQLYINITNCS